MNFDKFFELAKEKGIEQCQIRVTRASRLSIKLFHHEIDSYKVSDDFSISAAGIYNGKFGSASTQKGGKEGFEYLVNQIILSATYSEKKDEIGLFPGSPKYKKFNTFSKELEETPASKKVELLRELENAIYAYDPCITDANEVGYNESSSVSEFYNSHGLKLRRKSNFFYAVAGAVARKGDETKTYYDIQFGNKIEDFKPAELAEKICKNALSKFGGKSVKTKKYPTILDKDVAAQLIDYFLSSAIADEVQRHSSFLEGKLNQKVASSKLTIEEKPLAHNIFFSGFDDEGVATQNKVVIKNGVLQGYFYNRETAKKDGVESTGNGTWSGGKVGTGYGNIFVKPGKKSFDEMIAPIKEGVYITELAGLGTGMNSTSGDFSCQAEGYFIRDGKVAEPIALITLSGNLLKMLGDLREFDNNAQLNSGGMTIADCYIKSMNIGGN